MGVGQTLDFNVNIAGGKNIAGFQFTLTYDETALKFVEVKLKDYLPAGAFAVPAKVDPGSVLYGASTTKEATIKGSAGERANDGEKTGKGDGGQPPVEPVLLGDGATISANPAEIKSPAAGETLAKRNKKKIKKKKKKK